MLKPEQVMSVGQALDLSEPEVVRSKPAPRPSRRLALAAMAFIVAATVGGGIWVYWESAQIFHSFQGSKNGLPSVTGLSEADHVQRVARWQLVTTLVMAGGGGILIFITARGSRVSREAWQQESSLAAEQWEAETGTLRAQLSAHNATDEEARKEQESLNSQLADLNRANALLKDELNRRRQTEKSLAQQREELTRSKGVLELNVQARTQEVEKLQRRSELILNAAGDGICGFDLDGKIIFANPAAARILGRDVAEVIGARDCDLLGGFKAEASNGHHPTEVVASRRDGSNFTAEFIRSPLVEHGRPVGEVLVFTDITERKRAAESLAQKAAELARSNAELEQFAFVASHDLQEPLRKIQAFGDRLKTKCDEAGLTDGRDYLLRMENAAARMRTLIDDLLTFSRVISCTEPFGPVNLAAIAREVLGDLEVQIEKNQAQIQVGELCTLDADATQMRQLLQNLIGNALKFQPAGGKPVIRIAGRIISYTEASRNTAFATRKPGDGGAEAHSGEFFELTVQDNGIGFEEIYLEKIFAVFQRLHGRQEYEGTGVGLAVCRRIVDRHRGIITARSKLGEGATFVVLLPVPQPGKTKGDA